MTIPLSKLRHLLEQAFVDGLVLLECPRADDNHFQCVVVSQRFEGCTQVSQHKMVYQALGSLMGEEVHALALQTYTPKDWQAAQQQTN